MSHTQPRKNNVNEIKSNGELGWGDDDDNRTNGNPSPDYQ